MSMFTSGGDTQAIWRIAKAQYGSVDAFVRHHEDEGK